MECCCSFLSIFFSGTPILNSRNDINKNGGHLRRLVIDAMTRVRSLARLHKQSPHQRACASVAFGFIELNLTDVHIVKRLKRSALFVSLRRSTQSGIIAESSNLR